MQPVQRPREREKILRRLLGKVRRRIKVTGDGLLRRPSDCESLARQSRSVAVAKATKTQTHLYVKHILPKVRRAAKPRRVNGVGEVPRKIPRCEAQRQTRRTPKKGET